MASIKINDLSEFNFSGSELFQDSESFETELNDNDFFEVIGGLSPVLPSITTVTPTII